MPYIIKIIIAFISSFIPVFIFWFLKKYDFFVLSLTFPATVSFVLLLQSKIDRFVKGFYIIGLGVLIGLALPKLLHAILSTEGSIPEYIEILTQMFSYACTGAGGSIIAAHAENYLSDFDKKDSSVKIINNSDIEKIIANKIEPLKKQLLITNSITILVLVLAVVILLLK